MCVGPHRGQKRECSYGQLWATCGCWALNSGALEENEVLLITEQYLQAPEIKFPIKETSGLANFPFFV